MGARSPKLLAANLPPLVVGGATLVFAVALLINFPEAGPPFDPSAPHEMIPEGDMCRVKKERKKSRPVVKRERRTKRPESPPEVTEEPKEAEPRPTKRARKRKRDRERERDDAPRPKQLEDQQVLSVLRRNANDVRMCTRAHRDSGDTLEGKMQVRVLVSPNGRIKRASIGPKQFRATTVGRCVLDKVKRWRFPRFSGEPMPVDFPVNVRTN